MYVLFRDDLLDSQEISQKINTETLFRVQSDLTKATKREDVMAFQLSISVDDIDLGREFDWEDDEFFIKAESYTADLLKYFPKYTIQCSESYKWDNIENRIYLVVVISNIDLKLKKLKLDILKRMMKQID